MELPMKIIIVLGISLVGFFAFLNLSKVLLQDAEKYVDNLESSNDMKNILKVSSISGEELAYLAEDCKRIKQEMNTEMNINCYAIFSENTITSTNVLTTWTSVLGHNPSELILNINSGKAVFIIAEKDKIKIFS
jgi:hypothetical protein